MYVNRTRRVLKIGKEFERIRIISKQIFIKLSMVESKPQSIISQEWQKILFFLFVEHDMKLSVDFDSVIEVFIFYSKKIPIIMYFRF